MGYGGKVDRMVAGWGVAVRGGEESRASLNFCRE